jgi:hypothetical protein
VHTRPDASGRVEYIRVTFAQLIRVEMGESAAVEHARACAGAPTAEPFTHGPGARGGWLVRFPGGEFEVLSDGSCLKVE